MALISDIKALGTGILQPLVKWRFQLSLDAIGITFDNVISFERPKLSFSPVEVYFEGVRSYVAGKHRWEPLEVVIDSCDLNKALMVFELSERNKLSMSINLINADNVVQETWSLLGSRLVSVDSSDENFVAMQIEIDHARQANPVTTSNENAQWCFTKAYDRAMQLMEWQ